MSPPNFLAISLGVEFTGRTGLTMCEGTLDRDAGLWSLDPALLLLRRLLYELVLC